MTDSEKVKQETLPDMGEEKPENKTGPAVDEKKSSKRPKLSFQSSQHHRLYYQTRSRKSDHM